MSKRTVKRYSTSGILFHWIFSSIVIILVITGIEMFIPGRSAGGGHITGIIHRVAAVLFLAAPIIYSILFPETAAGFLKETFSWGKDDLKWFKTAPIYYFGGSGKKMPHQNRLNTGQKMWQLILSGTAIMFLITGSIIWLFRSAIAINVYEWILFFHGIAFIILLSMLLVHLFMSVLHPRMRGAFYSMIDGKVSSTYAREHHRKWYDELMQEEAVVEGKANKDLSS